MIQVQHDEVGGDRLVLTQKGPLKSFLFLSLRNGLLNVITLTLYRFWGRTEVRRRLWATTYLNDDPFEYTGKGIELFLGFLFAIGVVVLPFLIVLFGAQFLGPALAGLVILPLYIFLLFVFGFVRFTAFRYLATRTSWRGVRFHLRGSPTGFGLAWLGYVLLSAVTLGWFWPAAQRRLSGRLWGGLSFGNHNFQFHPEEARRVGVYGSYAVGWVLGIVGYVIFVAVIVATLAPQIAAAQKTGAPPGFTLAHMATIYIATGGLTLFYVFALAPFHAAMLRSVVAGIGFADVRFKLQLGWLEFALLAVSNIVLLTISLGFLMPFVEARSRKFLIARLDTRGAFDLAVIGQGDAPRPSTGEGLADAFGVATV